MVKNIIHVHEQVDGLQVAVDDIEAVERFQAFDEMLSYRGDDDLGETLTIALVLLDVFLEGSFEARLKEEGKLAYSQVAVKRQDPLSFLAEMLEAFDFSLDIQQHHSVIHFGD